MGGGQSNGLPVCRVTKSYDFKRVHIFGASDVFHDYGHSFYMIMERLEIITLDSGREGLVHNLWVERHNLSQAVKALQPGWTDCVLAKM